MKTYETEEGIIYCSNCGSALCEEEIVEEFCSCCQQLESNIAL